MIELAISQGTRRFLNMSLNKNPHYRNVGCDLGDFEIAFLGFFVDNDKMFAI